MDTNAKISIIITQSKNEDNNHRVLTSIDKQTNKNYELITLAENTVKQRKEAIKNSKGDYILFVDGNDFIEELAIENLLATANKTNAPIIISPIISDYAEGSITWKTPLSCGVTKQVDYIKYVEEYLFNTDDCNYLKLFYGHLFDKTKILTYYDVYDDITYEENTVFMTKFLLSVDEIYITDMAFYHRNKKEDFYFVDDTFIYQLQKVFNYLESFFSTLDNSDKWQKILINYYINLVMRDYKNMKFIKYDLDLYKVFSLADRYKNVVIYGAGAYGKFYHNVFKAKQDCNVVAWADKNLHGEYINDVLISNPEELTKLDYDIIIIAVVGKGSAEKIMEELNESFDIDEDKMLWLQKQNVRNYKI